MSDVERFGDEVQRAGKNGFNAAVSSFAEANKGLQAIAAEITAYSKKTFEDGTRAFEQLLGAKSFGQVIEIQSQYARMVYEAHVAELSKLGGMYAGLTRSAYKPIEQAAAEQAEKAGKSAVDAAIEAARLRLRPILMTSLAFIFGVLPLAISTGAGAQSRIAIGTAVIGGMLTATALAIFYVPLFFVLVRRHLHGRTPKPAPGAAEAAA